MCKTFNSYLKIILISLGLFLIPNLSFAETATSTINQTQQNLFYAVIIFLIVFYIFAFSHWKR